MTTSSLSVDETVLLRSIGWRPRGLVCGAASYSIPEGFWSLGKGESQPATLAWQRSVAHAIDEARKDCQRCGGVGVVGARLDISVTKRRVEAVFTGTATSPDTRTRRPPKPFACDLAVRDFVLLHRRGWQVLDLAYGAAFIFVRHRNPLAAASQVSQNAELTNYTEALYHARSAAMERMQASAMSVSADGVVGVHLGEGPMPFASHAMHFIALGTAIRNTNAGKHRDHDVDTAILLNDSPAIPSALSEGRPFPG